MTDKTTQQQPVLTISQLNRRVRQLLETHFPLLWVEGEISNLAQPSSGHIYFTLKDEQAQVRAAMFRNKSSRLNFKPANGTHVLARCRVGLYEGRGDFQLIIEHMEEAGFGALQRQFDALKAKLAEEGLFDDIHKQPLPLHPKRLGIITSPTGAAVQDVLNVLQRRYPALPITIYPVAVQGTDAPGQIVEAIQRANRPWPGSTVPRCDLLLLTRGGGSLEDLWAFNDEAVARAVFHSKLPIVSAVGHEIDFTIADFVADLRAATPSAAAELISQDQEALLGQLAGYRYYFEKQLKDLLSRYQQQLAGLSRRLKHPRVQLQQQNQKLDNLETRLTRLTHRYLTEKTAKLAYLTNRLDIQHPQHRLATVRIELNRLEQKLHKSIKSQLSDSRHSLQKTSELLETVSPLATLARGYAIVTNHQNQSVTDPEQVSPGEQVQARVRNGLLYCEVLKTETLNKTTI